MPVLQFRWQDFIDIFAVAFIIYRLLLFFVDTRAAQLVRGLLILVFVGFAAKILDFRVLSWFLSYMLSAFLIAIPILFQPELRSMLEGIGRGTLWGQNSDKAEAERKVDAVVRALLYLMEKRIGAILVFQRKTGLKDIWQSAVRMHSDITQELLISIFWPNNPLHDGAAIIDTQQVVAAACYLPLTDKKDLSRWYGTRHRAAIGITEVSDAVALVVSEEQGKISLAVNGRLSRALSEEQLRRFISRYFEIASAKEDTFKRLQQEMRSFITKMGHEKD